MENKEQVLLRMKEDILLRGLSKNTLESYTLNARIFLEHCNRPVEQLNEYDIRNFLWYLINEKRFFRTFDTRPIITFIVRYILKTTIMLK
ncbi:phage integrase N-terminal SAM-like domain-containing protein [Desulfoscipio gibsoniae]|uniref:phage integrase N-terminal SAM-like domain-containing protein n=1 Tax=Desulfoscipio gibsoniae TaxID=102134 RepID=UPI000232B438|nr:phage integrase N-terminal SAM-like domain-containing protein [Desulfoscipio gibsoniae]